MEGMVEEAIRSFMSEGGGKKVVVIMDGVDFMMAALGVGAGETLEMIGRIREVGFFYISFFSQLRVLFSINWMF